MVDSLPRFLDRRGVLRRFAAAGALPLLGGLRLGDGAPLVSAAQAAADYPGVQRNQGDVVHIPGAAVAPTRVAEWLDPGFIIGPYRIAASKAALETAPADASRYDAKLYNFPSGSLRVLTFRKGAPAMHLITFETIVYVLQGSATLAPVKGHPGTPVTIAAGDALFLPSGHIGNPKPREDVVLLLALVSPTVRDAKKAIVAALQAKVREFAHWQADGKEYAAITADEVKKAPKTATRFTTKVYGFEGSSLRVTTLTPGRTNSIVTARSDVLLYITKGRMRRMEGDRLLDPVVAGDAVRERVGNPGYWDVLEESSFIAVDAPLNPALDSPTSL
jgi:uncharacterized cupin superfamily protein